MIPNRTSLLGQKSRYSPLLFPYLPRSHVVCIVNVTVPCKCCVLPFLGRWSRDGRVEMLYLTYI